MTAARAATKAGRAPACATGALAIAVAVVLAPSGPAPAAAAGPDLSLSPSALVFPDQRVGAKSDALSVTLTNDGDAPLAISAVHITGADSSDFSQSAICPIAPDTLAAGSSCTIWVAFTPDSAGAKSASLEIGDDAASSPQSVALSGRGADTPTAQAAPASLAFGQVDVGSSSASQVVTLSNTGVLPLTLSSVSLSGADAADFGLTTTCDSKTGVDVGAGCTASVTFSPQSPGGKTATLVFTDDATGSPQSVSLSGTATAPAGPAVRLAPGGLSFGPATVGSTSAAQVVTVGNAGSADLEIGSIGLTGAAAADFAQTNDCPAALAPAASCTVSVTFTPTSGGTRKATLTISDNAGDSPQSVSLVGSGLAADVYLNDDFESGSLNQWSQLTSDGSSITLDSSQANSGSTSVRLRNTTDNSYADMYADLAGGGHAQSYTRFCFQVSAGLDQGVEIANGRAITNQYPLGIRRWEILYNPVTQGLEGYFFNENLDRLDMTAANGHVTPGHWYCAELYLNEQANGTAELWLDGQPVATVNGDLSTPNPYSRLQLWNQPAAGTVWFDDIEVANTPIGPTGTGSGNLPGPQATLNPTSLTFPTQTSHTTSTTQTITLTNPGNADLTINTITLTGTNPTDFNQTNNCPTNLAPTATCTLSITFTPTTAGTRTATLQLDDNATNTPQTVSLSGAGAAPDAASATLSTSLLSFGDQLVGVRSDALEVTLSNGGDQPLTISTFRITGSDSSDFAQGSTCPVAPDTLPVGSSCVIYVSFLPDSIGSKAASLVIGDDAVSSPQAVTLTGDGIAGP